MTRSGGILPRTALLRVPYIFSSASLINTGSDGGWSTSPSASNLTTGERVPPFVQEDDPVRAPELGVLDEIFKLW